MTDAPRLPPDLARPFRAPAGAVLFRPGEACPGFVLLARGSIRLDLVAEDGHQLLLYRVGPGEACALSVACLFSGEALSAEGVAETDLDGAMLPPDAFRRHAEADAAFRAALFAGFGARMGALLARIEELSFRSVDRRLAALLLARGAPEVAMTQERMAAEIGTAREVVTRRLGALARAGRVALSRGGARVLDRAALEEIARGG